MAGLTQLQWWTWWKDLHRLVVVAGPIALQILFALSFLALWPPLDVKSLR